MELLERPNVLYTYTDAKVISRVHTQFFFSIFISHCIAVFKTIIIIDDYVVIKNRKVNGDKISMDYMAIAVTYCTLCLTHTSTTLL